MSSPKKRTLVIILLLLLLVLLALLLGRCKRVPQPPPETPPATPVPGPAAAPPAYPTKPTAEPTEILTPATLQLSPQIVAGTTFSTQWTGPNNRGDYLTLARPDAPASTYATYADTSKGNPLELTAPTEAGAYEVRYVALRSKKILSRAPLLVTPATATLTAADTAVLNTPITITWTGPDNKDDFLTIVAPTAPDTEYGAYANTSKGSPVTLTSPATAGDAEIRYVTGQGRKVLARRPLKVTTPETSLTAPAEVIAGTPVSVTWTGPNNRGDFLTIVPPAAPASAYQNYTDSSKGSPLTITAPIEPGLFEIRYVVAQGKNILTRRPLKVVAATITLNAPAQAPAGSPVSIAWTGPNHKGDYVTIVTQGTPDGQYAAYVDTTRGTPLAIESPAKPGPAEIRYMSGQGAKVLARRAIEVTSP